MILGLLYAASPALGRRQFLRRVSVAALTFSCLPVLRGVAAAQISPPLLQLGVRPREAWAAGLPPRGELEQEGPGDVRFLLVHHTASSNQYRPDDVPNLIRGFYAAHTGPEKNWVDVAYNFFVDRYGAMWEGRAGSLAGPVKSDATGGSQGFAQLCCFIGDHQTEAPSPEARLSMIGLLSALADTYAIDTEPGATTTFTSRGSNRWPAGTVVTASTIAGHRDMSQTVCPGDAAYELVQSIFPAEVSATRRSPSTPPPPTAETTTPPPSPSGPMVPVDPTGATEPSAAASAVPAAQDGEIWESPIAGVAGGVLAAAAAGLLGRIILGRRAAESRSDNTTAPNQSAAQPPTTANEQKPRSSRPHA